MYQFLTFDGKPGQVNPNSQYSFNLWDASKKHTETDLPDTPSVRCRRENRYLRKNQINKQTNKQKHLKSETKSKLFINRVKLQSI